MVAVALASASSDVGRGRDDFVEGVEQVAGGANEPHLVDLGANFDANLFEQHGNGWVLRGGPGGRPVTESPALARGRGLGERRLGRIEAACGLSEAQRARLSLALESDVRRLAADIDAIRGVYAGLMINMNDAAGQKRWHQFQQDVQRCRDRLRRMLDDDSLFASVLETVLDDRQRACLEAETAARRSFRWRTMVSEALVRLDDSLGLSRRQHEALEKTLLAREPALRIDESASVRDDPHLRYHVVMMVLAGGDVGPVKEAVSERQWRTLSGLLNQGRAMRSFIEQQGIIEGRPR